MSRINIGAVLISALLDLVISDYCWYVHEDYATVQQKYCRSGCCQEYGDDDDICCFEWSVGIIIAIIFATVTIIVIIVILIICCYTMKKKRNRTGTVIDGGGGVGGTNISNTVIYSGASGYSYPHPPSAFYPSSQFPNAPPAYGPPPKYGLYPPTDPSQSQQSVTDQSQNMSLPPSYSSAISPGYPPTQQYGGYGTGMK